MDASNSKVTQGSLAISSALLRKCGKYANEPPAINAVLVPESDCRRVIAAMEIQPPTAPIQEAVVAAKRLLGLYPQRKVSDVKMYTAGIVAALAAYPANLYSEAINRITSNCKFLPTRAELIEILDGLTAQRRAALLGAQRQLKEHARRKSEAAAQVEQVRDRVEILDRFGSYEAYFDHVRGGGKSL